MYKQLRITVVIPCLNEEQGIEKVLRRMPGFVDEVIVVDNNSTDATATVAASLGATVIREDVRGYGRSYKRGFATSTGDVIITLERILADELPRGARLDLEDVTLVTHDAVAFLARVASAGVALVNCPDYVRSWIAAHGTDGR